MARAPPPRSAGARGRERRKRALLGRAPLPHVGAAALGWEAGDLMHASGDAVASSRANSQQPVQIVTAVRAAKWPTPVERTKHSLLLTDHESHIYPPYSLQSRRPGILHDGSEPPDYEPSGAATGCGQQRATCGAIASSPIGLSSSCPTFAPRPGLLPHGPYTEIAETVPRAATHLLRHCQLAAFRLSVYKSQITLAVKGRARVSVKGFAQPPARVGRSRGVFR
jgi:hypothetical protein